MHKPTLESLQQFEAQNAISKGMPEQVSGNNINDFIDKLYNTVDTYIGQPGRALTAGIGQGLEHAGASTANLLPQLLGLKARVPFVDWQENFRDKPSNNLAFMGGNILGNAIPGISGANLINKTLGGNSLLKDAIAGATSGFITGGQSEDADISRILSAILGGTAPVVGGLAKPTLANRVVKREASLNNEMQQLYDNAFNAAEQRGLSDVPITSLKNVQIKTKLPATAKDSLSSFFENPTFSQAHDAQSDLGKVIRDLESKFSARAGKNRPVLSSEEKNVQALEQLRKNIQEGIQKHLETNNASDIANAYVNAGQRYAKEYSPYLEGAIKRYKEGDIGSGKLIKELQRVTESPYKGGHYSDIKGFQTRQQLEPLINILKKAGLIGGAVYAGGKLSSRPGQMTVEALADTIE